MESQKKSFTRTRWVVGNWKQHLLCQEASSLAEEIAAGLPESGGGDDDRLQVGVAPTALSLASVRPTTRPQGRLWLFAQNGAAQESGAFTGELGPAMLRDVGAHGVILGHSERRKHFHEDDALIARKLRCALDAGLRAILCVGEPLEIREAGEHEPYVLAQLAASLAAIDPGQLSPSLLIAYEPVWAIGTGVAATPEDAAAMHRRIRGWLGEHFGSPGSDRSILYGGSVNPDNAPELLATGELDGFLVGGASLRADSFLRILQSATHG